MCPAVTARYVEANRLAGRNWLPLPEPYIPPGGVLTFNLLGYEEIQQLDMVGRQRCEGIFFPDDDAVERRLKYAPQ